MRFKLSFLCCAVLASTLSWATDCQPISSEARTRLIQYVRQKYNIPGDRVVEMENDAPNSACYRAVRFSFVDIGQSAEWQFILAPDQRFLLTDIYDSFIDPREEELQRKEALLKDLSGGPYPSLGADNAPVTLTVFSDFECPACKRAEPILKDVISTQISTVRLVFRHMPLSFHPWAREAAISATCVATQSSAAFWTLHDYLFDHQRDITAQNIRETILEHIQHDNVDIDKYKACVAGPEAQKRVQADISAGVRNGVRGTPTLFINDMRIQGIQNREQLLTLIRQTLARTSDRRKQ